MNQLVFKSNDQVVTSSRNIARDFGKEHKNVLRDIRGLLKNEPAKEMFFETTYIHEANNQEFTKYLMNRDGFTLLVMGFTGRKAMQFKMQYIQAFNQMEKELRKTMSPTELALLQAKNVYELEQRVNNHETKLTLIENNVENEITLSYGEQRRLQKAVGRRVYKLFTNKDDRPQAFADIYREIKDRFGVASYKDVRRQDLQDAINYVNNWIPRKVAM